MSAQHTPGPWLWRGDGCELLNRNGAQVLCIDLPEFISDEDKRLIAAAPDLYAAIKDSMEYLDLLLGPCDADCGCILHGLRAAVAKAEGRP